MVHLLPLPGSPRWGRSLDAVLDRARADARALAAGGVDAVLVENFGDIPFHPRAVPPWTVAAMTAAVLAVRQEVDLPVGVNVLRNAAAAALAVAAAAGGAFIRVNVHTGTMFSDQGWLEGRADRTVRRRARVAPDVAILADVLVKHGTPPAGLSLEDAGHDAWHRGLADALIVSGSATGRPTLMDDIRRVREAVPEAPVLAGSGVTAETVAEILRLAHGVIVGSALERGGTAGGPVKEERVRRLVDAART